MAQCHQLRRTSCPKKTRFTTPKIRGGCHRMARQWSNSRALLQLAALDPSIITCLCKETRMLDKTRDLEGLSYQSRQFNHVSYAIEKALWAFLTRAENIAQIENVTAVERAAVEALSDPLIAEFGIEVDQREVKQ